jgi:hypothetical protein
MNRLELGTGRYFYLGLEEALAERLPVIGCTP